MTTALITSTNPHLAGNAERAIGPACDAIFGLQGFHAAQGWRDLRLGKDVANHQNQIPREKDFEVISVGKGLKRARAMQINQPPKLILF